MTATDVTGSDRDSPSFFSVAETARYLRLCQKHVRRLIQRRELPAYRFGTALRIRREDVEDFVRARLV